MPECVKRVSRAQFRRPAHWRAANAAAACNKVSRGRNRLANSLARCGHAPWLGCELHVRFNTKVSVSRAKAHAEQRSCEKKTAAGVRSSPPPWGDQRVKWNSVALIEWISLSVYLYRTFHVIYLHLRIAYRRLNKSTICWIYNFSSFYNLSFDTQVHFCGV